MRARVCVCVQYKLKYLEEKLIIQGDNEISDLATIIPKNEKKI